MTDIIENGASASTQAVRAEDIFRRYPHISDAEAKEAVVFLKKGRHLDIGLVTGMVDLKENIAAFRDQHARQLGLAWGEIIGFTTFFALMLVTVVWLLAK